MMVVVMAAGLRALLQGLQRLLGLVEIARLQRAADLVEQRGEIAAIAPGLALALLTTALVLINFGVDALSNPQLREE